MEKLTTDSIGKKLLLQRLCWHTQMLEVFVLSISPSGKSAKVETQHGTEWIAVDDYKIAEAL